MFYFPLYYFFVNNAFTVFWKVLRYYFDTYFLVCAQTIRLEEHNLWEQKFFACMAQLMCTYIRKFHINFDVLLFYIFPIKLCALLILLMVGKETALSASEQKYMASQLRKNSLSWHLSRIKLFHSVPFTTVYKNMRLDILFLKKGEKSQVCKSTGML